MAVKFNRTRVKSAGKGIFESAGNPPKVKNPQSFL
jgi:hypothetical protein